MRSLGKRTRRGVGLTGIANVLSGTMGIVGPVDYSRVPELFRYGVCFPLYFGAGRHWIVCLCFFPGIYPGFRGYSGAVMGAVLLYLMASQLSAGLQMLTREKCVVGFESGLIIAFPLMVALLLSFAPGSSFTRYSGFDPSNHWKWVCDGSDYGIVIGTRSIPG